MGLFLSQEQQAENEAGIPFNCSKLSLIVKLIGVNESPEEFGAPQQSI